MQDRFWEKYDLAVNIDRTACQLNYLSAGPVNSRVGVDFLARPFVKRQRHQVRNVCMSRSKFITCFRTWVSLIHPVLVLPSKLLLISGRLTAAILDWFMVTCASRLRPACHEPHASPHGTAVDWKCVLVWKEVVFDLYSFTCLVRCRAKHHTSLICRQLVCSFNQGNCAPSRPFTKLEE